MSALQNRAMSNKKRGVWEKAGHRSEMRSGSELDFGYYHNADIHPVAKRVIALGKKQQKVQIMKSVSGGFYDKKIRFSNVD